MEKKTFSITAAKQTVKLDAKRTGETSFTVTNTSAKPIRGQLKLRPVEAPSIAAGQPGWFTLVGDGERNFAPQATTQVSAKITVPASVQSGKYGVRLDAVSSVNPDDDLTEGPPVVIEVPAAEQVPKKKFPWWIPLAAAVAVLLIGLVVWLVLPSGKPVPPPAVVKEAPKPEAPPVVVKEARKPEAPPAGGTYFVVAKHSGKCLHQHGATQGNGDPITQWDCVDQPNVKLEEVPAGEGYVFLKFQHSGKCVHQYGATQGNGDRITQWECVNQPNVKLKKVPASDGYFFLKFQHSGKCVHQQGATQGNGDPITQWDCVDQPNVQWKFKPVP